MQKLYIFLIVVLCINLSLQVNKHQLKKAKSMNSTTEITECPTGQVLDWDESTQEMECKTCEQVFKGSVLKWGWCQCPEASNFDTNECMTCAENDENSYYHSEGDYGWCKCKDGCKWGHDGKCEAIDCEAERTGTVWNAAKHQCECPTGERWNWENSECAAAVCKIPGTVFDEMSKHCECPKFHHLSHKEGSKKHASNDTTVQKLLKKNGTDAEEDQWECKFQCPNDREEDDGDCVCKENSHEYVYTNTDGTTVNMGYGASHAPHCQCNAGFGGNLKGNGTVNGGCKPCDSPRVSDHGWCMCPAMMRENWESEAKECICDDHMGVVEGEAGACQCPEGQSWVLHEGSAIHGWCQQATATL